jgi:hypothetical protein
VISSSLPAPPGCGQSAPLLTFTEAFALAVLIASRSVQSWSSITLSKPGFVTGIVAAPAIAGSTSAIAATPPKIQVLSRDIPAIASPVRIG